jgi:type VI secretion system protein VasG
MSKIKRTDMLARLDTHARGGVENAMKSAKLRGNPYVEFVHWIEQLALIENGDIQRICHDAGVDASRLAADLTRAIDSLPRGATSISDISDDIFDACERGWVYASLGFKSGVVRSGHILYGILQTRNLAFKLFDMSNEFRKIGADALGGRLEEVIAGSVEHNDRAAGLDAGHAGASSGAMAAPPAGGSALEKFATDLTARAHAGEIDPIVGRDRDPPDRRHPDAPAPEQPDPHRRGRRRQDRGGGGLRPAIADGDVPPPLQGRALRVLDIGLLQAGASMKGEFEKRLRRSSKRSRPRPSPSSCSSTRRTR